MGITLFVIVGLLVFVCGFECGARWASRQLVDSGQKVLEMAASVRAAREAEDKLQNDLAIACIERAWTADDAQSVMRRRYEAITNHLNRH